MTLNELIDYHKKQADHFAPFGASNALTLFHRASAEALTEANERIEELETDLGHSQMAATAEAQYANEINAKLAAEREVSDKLLEALKEACKNRGLAPHSISVKLHSIIAEVEATRKEQE